MCIRFITYPGRHMVYKLSREDLLKNVTCANEGCVTFGYQIVVENRIRVWFSGKGVESVVGGKNWKAAVCDNKIRWS